MDLIPARYELVTGSRHWSAQRALLSILDARVAAFLHEVFGGGDITGKPWTFTVVHGRNPRGADYHAGIWVRTRQRLWGAGHIAEKPFPVTTWTARCRPECAPGHRRTRRDGSDFCPAQGVYRNQRMIDFVATLPDAERGQCQAFFQPGAANRGAADCARRARAAGIEVREHH